MQKSKENIFMRAALAEAYIAYSIGEIPIGCVIVRQNTIIARAYNLTETKNDFTMHAELMAIQTASQTLRSKYLNECELFSTLEPCPMCMTAIKLSRICKVYYGAFRDIDVTGTIERYGGILEFECGKLLQDFYKKKR